LVGCSFVCLFVYLFVVLNKRCLVKDISIPRKFQERILAFCFFTMHTLNGHENTVKTGTSFPLRSRASLGLIVRIEYVHNCHPNFRLMPLGFAK